MAEPSDLSYAGRTLVVVFCMHRSGSSLVSNLFHRLGMSLGPFELIGAAESNKYGHFEAVPFCTLNRELQTRIFGFPDDLPESAEVLDGFCKRGGDGRTTRRFPRKPSNAGPTWFANWSNPRRFSGFKDPRTVLLWPFWTRVLSRFPVCRSCRSSWPAPPMKSP